MKKLITITFLLIIIQHNIQAQETIEAKIEYNEAKAKIEAFRDVEYKIDKTIFKDYLKDKNYKENINSINNKIAQIEDRYLCPFYIKNTLIAYSGIHLSNSSTIITIV